MNYRISGKFTDEIQLILDKEEFMDIIDVFESAITLSDDQIDLWNELESYKEELRYEN